MSQSQRVIIVGAGSAGCVLAARLSENPDREVVLIEEGDWLNAIAPADHRLVGRVAGSLAGPAGGSRRHGSLSLAFDPMTSRSWDVMNPGDRTISLRAGRIVGGSSAVNGCYFIRATGPDLAQWADIAGPRYSTEGLAPYFAKLENDLDFGDEPGHGSSGPVPVERDTDPLHPVSGAFRDATLGWGATYEPDKNAPGAFLTGGAGVGPVPFNSRSGERVDMATCYLDPIIGIRSGLKVMTNTRTTRVLLQGRVAVGVEVAIRGERPVAIEGDLVILAAGAIGSPGLLLASGIGPADDLRRTGVEPLVDLPEVGANLFNHPTVDLSYQPTAAVLRSTGASGLAGPGVSGAGPSFMQLALHTSAAAGGPGDFELMAARRPYGLVTGQRLEDTALSIRTTLLQPSGRGSVRLEPLGGGGSGANALVITHRPAGTSKDRESFRSAARLGDELMRSPEFRQLVESRSGPSAMQLRSDAELDGWIRSNAGFSFHQMGTCAMGTSDDAVVDPEFRVRGVDHLAVVDASVIPVGLSRGPAATVVALAEAAAAVLATDT